MSTTDNDDDDISNAMYENGYWMWDDKKNELVFKRNPLEQIMQTTAKVTHEIFGSVEFREDIDLNEQQRFRKRIQRKSLGENDVVTLQDIKDVVLLTAPTKIIKPYVINLFHLPATDRILRALILYCQYYLQISDIMTERTAELASKIRTCESEQTELIFMDNLQDLRLLIAKEYSNMILGAGEFAKYHHMGPEKKMRSMLQRESFMFETFIRICIQIIWIALARKSFNQIELELNRIFKTPIFNSAEHKLNKRVKKEESDNKEHILIGHCLHKDFKIEMMSPLMNEVHCTKRNIDHRIYGLGIIQYPRLSSRLHYMDNVLNLPENLLEERNISIGILGQKRSKFDILLREICIDEGSTTSVSSVGLKKDKSVKSSRMAKQQKLAKQMHSNIEIPPKSPHEDDLLAEFPSISCSIQPCNDEQRKKWLLKYAQIQKKIRRTHFSGARIVK